MSISANPTARAEVRATGTDLVFGRTVDRRRETVWAAITDPDRLREWIGTYTGDPASGRVEFFMTAEDENAPAEACRIRSCTAPRHLSVEIAGPEGSAWILTLDLAAEDDRTILTLAQPMDDADLAASVGPGWEYYLDRLVAAVTGTDVTAISFDDYYPAQAEYFRRLLSR